MPSIWPCLARWTQATTDCLPISYAMKRIDLPVCVVDDDASIRESVESLLRAEGLRVETYCSAQEFLARSSVEGPGCLVLDVELPGLSGLELQRELFRAEPDIPIIFL